MSNPISFVDHSRERQLRFACTARELIDIGVFGALYVVTSFVCVLAGIVMPPLMPFSLALGIIAAAVPFVLFLTRVTHAGQFLLFVLVVSGVQLLTGHPLLGIAFALLLAVLVELVLWVGRYRGAATAVVSYTVFAAWSIGPFLPLLTLTPNQMLADRLARMGGEQLAEVPTQTVLGILVGVMLGSMLLGCIGALFATRMLRTQFVRAGLA